MLKYVLGRVLVGFAVLLVVSVIAFTLTNTANDPAQAIAGEGASRADIDAVRKAYGLDRPVVQRYGLWLQSTLAGDFGVSIRQKRPVLQVIAERLPVTATLGVLALALAIGTAIPLGVAAALWPHSWLDRLALAFATIGQAVPTFWLALLGIVLFSVDLGWLPASGIPTFAGYVLPAVALSNYAIPTLLRLTRSGMLEVMKADYIRTARAKGLSWLSIVFKHGMRNAILPVVSVAAVQFGFMLGGSVVIETVFALPGVGYLAWQSISLSDLPVVQAIVLLVALAYITLTIAADIFNAWLDPRSRIS